MKEIIVDETFFENFGSGSLLGHIWNQFGKMPKQLTITFKQSSLEYRKNHNGPKIWMMPEYSNMCLLKDIIFLKDNGVSIEIKELLED